MPKLQDHDLLAHALGTYGYSAVGIDILEDAGASEYTLVVIVQDESGSVSTYRKQMEECIQEVIKACNNSPRAENLLIRFVAFNSTLTEVHGFKLLSQCKLDDYDGCLNPRAATALFDATENGIASAVDYGKQLTDADFMVNAIVVIITDGEDNVSKGTILSVKKSLEGVVRQECLESIITILVGVGMENNNYVKAALDQFHKDAGLTQFVEVDKANASTLAKLADFISKSISSQSQALGSGGPSQLLSGPSINVTF